MTVKLIKVSTNSKLELDFYDLFWKFECIFLYMMSQLLNESLKINIFIIKVLNSYNHPISNGVDSHRANHGHGHQQPAHSGAFLISNMTFASENSILFNC